MAALKPRFIAGGPEEDDEPQAAPQRKRYPCVANGCPMPGTIFASSGDRGVCAWHYGAVSNDWPRITQVLNDWHCVSDEANEMRRVTNDPGMCTDVRAQDDAIRQAWLRLKPALDLGGWNDSLKPGATESCANWGRRLEAFLGGQVLAVMSDSPRRAA